MEKLLDFLENKGFKIVAQKKLKLSKVKQKNFMIFIKKDHFLMI